MKLKIFFNKASFLVLIFFLLVAPLFTFGQTIINPLPNITDVNTFIKTILEGVIKIGIPVVAVAFVYSGFLFVSALGNPQKLEEAKRAFMYTLIGAAILIGSWAIAQLITETVLQIQT